MEHAVNTSPPGSKVVEGIPYIAGHPESVEISNFPKPGIRLQVDNNEPYLLDLNSVSPNKFMGARFVSSQWNNGPIVNVIEHICSALVLFTNFSPSALITIQTKKNLLSLLTGENTFVPAMGAGVAGSLEQIECLDIQSQDFPTEMKFQSDFLNKVITPQSINGREYSITGTECGDLKFSHNDTAKRIERAITISPAGSMKASVLSSFHPDAQETSIGRAATVDYLKTPYEEKLLTARAMGRTASPFIYQVVGFLEKIKLFQGITDKTYFKVKPKSTMEEIVNSMNPVYQEDKNEHFRHTLGADFPFELYLFCRSLETDHIHARFTFENATHDTRLDVLNLLYKMHKENNTIFSYENSDIKR